MELIEKIQIDALVIREREQTERDKELGRQAYNRANDVLRVCPDSWRTQIIHGSDDDRSIHVKEKPVIYESEEGKSKLVLTNFYNNGARGPITVEVYDLSDHIGSSKGEVLFAVTPEGEVTSPLGLINSSLANAAMELFETVPKVDSVKAV